MSWRVAARIGAALLALIGAMLIWTELGYAWLFYSLMHAPPFDAPTPTESQPFYVPAVGIMAMYYLIHLGIVPSISILMCAGIMACILAYIVVRRSR